MKKTTIHTLFAITILTSFVACEKKAEVVVESEPAEEAPETKTVVEEVKEDLKGIAAKAEAEVKVVVESVQASTAENLEIAKEKVSKIKAEAAVEMIEVVEAVDETLDAAGAALKDVQKNAVESLNNMLKPTSE